MSELTEYIKADNIRLVAEGEAKGWIVGTLSEDESWWAARDVHTVEDFKRWEMEAVMSDLAKDAYGTRGMCPDTSNMSFEELKAAYDRLCDLADATAKEEQEEQALCVTQFEATVADTIASGAGNRETAIRWLKVAEDADDRGDDYFEYCNNLPYGYLKSATCPEMV